MSLEFLLQEPFDLRYVGEGAANVVFRILRKEESVAVSRAYGEALPSSSSVPDDLAGVAGSDPELLNAPKKWELYPRDVRDQPSIAASPQSGSVPSLYRSDSQDSGHDVFSQLSDFPLLRLRKDLATVTPVLEAHQNFERMIKPFLESDELVRSDLASLPPALVDRCNDVLLEMEAAGIRPKKRRNGYLAYQPYANLVQDMSARSSTDSVIEFKPKWLSQSPSAPESATRCRTCALRAMRQDKEKETSLTSAFCPLDLVTGDRTSLLSVLKKQLQLSPRLPATSSSYLKAAADAIANHLLKSGVMEKIGRLQVRMDPHGIMGAKIDDEFLMAMTLRDCTVFIRVDKHMKAEARLGDIDLKPVTKSSYWRLIEQRLIEEGWYTCSESGKTGKDPVCALSR